MSESIQHGLITSSHPARRGNQSINASARKLPQLTDLKLTVRWQQQAAILTGRSVGYGLPLVCSHIHSQTFKLSSDPLFVGHRRSLFVTVKFA